MQLAAIRSIRDGADAGAIWRSPPGKRGVLLLERLVAGGQGGVAVRKLGRNRAGEVRLSRFLHNERVTPEAMVAAAAAGTAARVRGRYIVAPEDTTSLRDDGDQRSLHLHPMIALDGEDGSLIGLVHAQVLHRAGGKRTHTGTRAFADKESRRWLTAIERAGALIDAGAASVTVVADREADIYETFALRPSRVELVIRAQQNRSLLDGGLLYDCLDAHPELGRETIELPAAPGRPARQATLALRACKVRIKRPQQSTAAETAALPPQVALFYVEAREVDPPTDGAVAHWRLLTTYSVTDLATARRITAIYRQRWTIEQLFRVMKTKGFDIEASQVGEGGPFENLATATLIAAIKVLQMVRERDGAAQRPLEDVFDAAEMPAIQAINATLEGKTARQKNPHRPGSLAYASWVCARLGGWNGYYGKPGPITIHNGLKRLRSMLHGWALGRDV
jgi:hypothetical protein